MRRRFIACTLMGMSPWPVRKIIGIALSFVVRASWSSRPFKPGIAMSSTRQPGALRIVSFKKFLG